MNWWQRLRGSWRRPLERVTAQRAGEPDPVEAFPEHEPEPTSSVMIEFDQDVPRGVRLAAAWSWRLVVIGLLGYFLLELVSLLRIVVVPLVVALLLTALLGPAVLALRRLGAPRALAAAVVLITGIAAVAATLTGVISQFIDGLPQLSHNASEGIGTIQSWLKTGPLHLSDAQLDQWITKGRQWLNGNAGSLGTSALSAVGTVSEMLAGVVLVLFSTFFFLRDGDNIWRFTVRLLPPAARHRLHHAGHASWRSLGAYVRATVLVAFIDAIGIGIALYVLKVPFALPLAALVFLGAFVPIIGAALSGTVAVLVALVDVNGGAVKALLVLAAVILVQQLEGHVLQPLIMGKAVAIHPLAVIVAITGGVVLAGIIGALVAVPLVAVLNTGIRHVAASRPPVRAAEPSAST